MGYQDTHTNAQCGFYATVILNWERVSKSHTELWQGHKPRQQTFLSNLLGQISHVPAYTILLVEVPEPGLAKLVPDCRQAPCRPPGDYLVERAPSMGEERNAELIFLSAPRLDGEIEKD